MTQITTTADELRKIVREEIQTAFEDAGLRIDDVNQQFEARQDFSYLRKLRRTTEGAASKIGMAVLMAIVSGIIWVLMAGTGTLFGR